MALDVSARFMRAFTLLLDGDLVFVDEDRLWRVHGNRVSLFAGTGVNAPSSLGDGGPATDAALEDVADLVTSRDGSVYIAEDLVGRVRRVTPDGPIWSFAQHLGGAADLLFTEDGNLLVAGVEGAFVEIATDGSITHVIPGYPDFPGSRDRLAKKLIFGARGSDVALDTQGNLYVSVNVTGYQNVLRISAVTIEDIV